MWRNLHQVQVRNATTTKMLWDFKRKDTTCENDIIIFDIWNISCCMYKQNHLSCLVWRHYLHVLLLLFSIWEKYFRVTNVKEEFWMFVTLIRYIFPHQGNCLDLRKIWRNRFKTNIKRKIVCIYFVPLDLHSSFLLKPSQIPYYLRMSHMQM